MVIWCLPIVQNFNFSGSDAKKKWRQTVKLPAKMHFIVMIFYYSVDTDAVSAYTWNVVDSWINSFSSPPTPALPNISHARIVFVPHILTWLIAALTYEYPPKDIKWCWILQMKGKQFQVKIPWKIESELLKSLIFREYPISPICDRLTLCSLGGLHSFVLLSLSPHYITYLRSGAFRHRTKPSYNSEKSKIMLNAAATRTKW